MASIIEINGKYRAQIRRKGHKTLTKTHPTKAAAEAWVKGVEKQIATGAPIDAYTVADLTRIYRELREGSRPILDTSNEHYMLKAINRLLGKKDAFKLSTDDLVAYCQERKDEGAGPYTINMDLSKLSTAMRYAGSFKKLQVPDSVGQARPLLTHLGMIGGANKRERRPTQDEMERIDAHLREGRGVIYAEAVLFAACSAMRRGEICSILRSEIDPKTRVVLVWRKHPRKGKVLEKVPLMPEAYQVALRQPESEDGRVFPIEPGTLSKYFTETCRALGIPDLHLHDMRHEWTSQLFEQGYEIPQVALVTGHKKWETLRRYTQLKPESMSEPKPPGLAAGRTPRQRPERQPSAGRRQRRSAR